MCKIVASASRIEFALTCSDVVSMSRVSKLAVISGADGVSFGSLSVSFGMRVAPTLAPDGHSSDPGALGIGPGLDFYISRVFSKLWAKTCIFVVFVSMSCFLMSSGSESGLLGL